jgi:hypothetical protein
MQLQYTLLLCLTAADVLIFIHNNSSGKGRISRLPFQFCADMLKGIGND